jgi:hypothetical protein
VAGQLGVDESGILPNRLGVALQLQDEFRYVFWSLPGLLARIHRETPGLVAPFVVSAGCPLFTNRFIRVSEMGNPCKEAASYQLTADWAAC